MDSPWAAWIGRTELRHDLITAAPLRALQATLDHAPTAFDVGAPVPPLWHWLYCVPMPRASEIGPDGHAQRGGFLPPVPLPRRMWAGSRFEFHKPIRVGDPVVRQSTVESVTSKAGRDGELVFVTVCHALHRAGEAAPALREWHDIVYRAAPRAGDPGPTGRSAPNEAQFQSTIVPDDVLLFRYSALTFNAHRIHYDRRYVTEVEGYPGLVVHGPLIATLLLDLLSRELPAASLRRFQFRALRPAFDGAALQLAGRCDGDTVRLWAQDGDGLLCMEAEATLG